MAPTARPWGISPAHRESGDAAAIGRQRPALPRSGAAAGLVRVVDLGDLLFEAVDVRRIEAELAHADLVDAAEFLHLFDQLRLGPAGIDRRRRGRLLVGQLLLQR